MAPLDAEPRIREVVFPRDGNASILPCVPGLQPRWSVRKGETGANMRCGVTGPNRDKYLAI